MSLGVNVSADGSVPADFIASTGAKLARYVGHRSGQRNYAQSLLEHGITPVLVLGSEPESLGQDPTKWLQNARDIVKEHKGLSVIHQGANEPDAGWEPGRLSEWRIEERKAAHPSSWIMTWAEYDYLIDVCRSAVGSGFLVGAGLCSGHPSWLAGLSGQALANMRALDALACHPYAKFPNTPELRGMLDGYRSFQKPVWVTEYDSRTLGMAAYLRDYPGVVNSCAFALHDGVPEFQMRGATLADFKAAATELNQEPAAGQQGPYSFQLGFLDMYTANPRLIGEPDGENEWGPRVGISQQKTTTGLLSWFEPSTTPKREECLTFYEWATRKRFKWVSGTRAVVEVRG